MATQQRDPRKDPKKGDVIRFPGALRSYEIAKVDGDVFLWGRDHGRRVPMSYCLLANWPRLAQNVEVIYVA